MSGVENEVGRKIGQMKTRSKKAPGRVILVGAGPGEPSLITLRAKWILENADVVLYDFLVHPTLLSWCKPGAILRCVGKKKGHHLNTQAEILELMKQYSQDHALIVRLKGGDPMIFGRASEELQFLNEHGIPFEIVPGVTSAITVPTYAGIPLTARCVARSVAFVTGSVESGDELSASAFPCADTLVFLMGVTHLSSIVQTLLRGNGAFCRFGYDTPVGIIERGSLSGQSVLVSTLGDIESDPRVKSVSSPAIVIVGDVVAFHSKLNWISQCPLFGQRVVLLRGREDAYEWFKPLSLAGAEVLINPVFECVQTNVPLDVGTLDESACVVFTSQHGVRAFVALLLRSGRDVRSLMGKSLASIGPKTTAVMASYGLIADIESPVSTAKSLAECLIKRYPKAAFFWPCSSSFLPDLLVGLNASGARVTQAFVYDTVPSELFRPESIMSDDFVLFTNPMSVDYFCEAFSVLPQIRPIAIGASTQEAVLRRFHGCEVLAPPTCEALQQFLYQSKTRF